MRKLKILIVDDNIRFQTALKFFLEDRFEERIKQVDTTRSGKAFLEKIESDCYDLVFMDVSNPDSHGLEILRKAAKSLTDVRIIALSYHSDFKYIVRILDAGAYHYLIKDEINTEHMDKVMSKIA